MEFDKNKPFYHGSNLIIQHPDLSKSRKDIDFGKGFYLTESPELASKWACGKKGDSFVNQYFLNTEGLKIKELGLNKEWLHYVAGNRTKHPSDFDLYFDDSTYDVIVGPIADDNLFTTIDLYLDGFISATKTVRVMNCMDYGNQIVLKTDKALKQLEYFTARKLIDAEERKYQKLHEEDKIIKMEKTAVIMRSIPDVWRDYYEH